MVQICPKLITNQLLYQLSYIGSTRVIAIVESKTTIGAKHSHPTSLVYLRMCADCNATSSNPCFRYLRLEPSLQMLYGDDNSRCESSGRTLQQIVQPTNAKPTVPVGLE